MQVGAAEQYRSGAEIEGCGNPAPVADSACRDDRNAHRIGNLREQREEPQRFGRIGAEKAARVSSGFETLRNDRIGSTLLEPDRLLDRRRIADDSGAGRSDALEQVIGGKAEVEADDFGPDLL